MVAIELASAARTRAARLSEARRLLSRVARARSGGREPGVSTDDERILPVPTPLRSVLPGGGLRRGATVAISSSTALLLSLLAEASIGGAWCALVGLPRLGLVAAKEAGLVLSRVVLVPRPGGDAVSVAATLLDGMDAVAVAGVERFRPGDRRRLAARARRYGAVLLPVGRWPEADLELEMVAGRWCGLAGDGAGRLRFRRAQVRVRGRGAAQRERRVSVLLPGPEGALAEGRGRVVSGPVAEPKRAG